MRMRMGKGTRKGEVLGGEREKEREREKENERERKKRLRKEEN
jgi:hypothetical protein